MGREECRAALSTADFQAIAFFTHQYYITRGNWLTLLSAFTYTVTTLNTLRPRSSYGLHLMCPLIYWQSARGICTWSYMTCLPYYIHICVLQEYSARQRENIETREARLNFTSNNIYVKINAKKHKVSVFLHRYRGHFLLFSNISHTEQLIQKMTDR